MCSYLKTLQSTFTATGDDLGQRQKTADEHSSRSLGLGRTSGLRGRLGGFGRLALWLCGLLTFLWRLAARGSLGITTVRGGPEGEVIA